MLGDFNKLFMEKPRADGGIPKGILEALSFDMPEGFEYKDIGDGLCMLDIPEGTSIKGRLRLNGSSRENLLKCKSFIDLMSYATNLQQPIQIEGDENGFFELDDQKISSDQFVQSPLKDIEIRNGRLIIPPQKLDQSFEIPLSISDDSMVILMKRVIYDSVDWIKFSGDSGIGFSIAIFMKPGEPEIKLTISTNFSHSKTVENVIKCIKYYNSFANGSAKIFDSLVNSKNEAEMIPFATDVIEFWNQLYSLEKVFNVFFSTSRNVYKKDVQKVRELYRSLIKNKPFRINETITKLNSTSAFSTNVNIDDIEGKELLFRFVKEETVEILGVDLSVSAVKYIFGTKIKKFSFDEETRAFSIILDRASEDIDPYTATLYFANTEDLKSFLESEDDNTGLFANAETIPNVDN